MTSSPKTNEPAVDSIRIENTKLTGVRRITADGWDGEILDMSRNSFLAHSVSQTLNRAATYIIFADHFDKATYGCSLYVGQGDDVRKRLSNHASDKPFWNRVLIFTSPKMNVALTFNVERNFISSVKCANRYNVTNGDDGQTKKLGDEDTRYVEEFVRISRAAIELAKIDIFEFNQDGRYLFKDHLNDAAIRINSEDLNSVTVLEGSQIWSYYIENDETERLAGLNVIELIDKQIRFKREWVTPVDSTFVPRIFGKLMSLNKFQSNCGVSAETAIKVLTQKTSKSNG